MSDISYKNVTGFNLKWPCRNANRPRLSSKGEWITFNKKKNQLPTATLRTWVFYHRYNGDASDNAIELGKQAHVTLGAWETDDTDSPQPNFRFYNNYTSSVTDVPGGQLGHIWGFPLFNVDQSGNNPSMEKGPNNWTYFQSCRSGDSPTITNGVNDICGNERMLVDISEENNIIILDFSGFDWEGQTFFDEIKNNLNPYVNDGFYVSLRIKSSNEQMVADDNSNFAYGRHFHLYDYDANSSPPVDISKNIFGSLVEYTFECDIIGPKPMLDLTLSHFSFYSNQSQKGELLGHGNNIVWPGTFQGKYLVWPGTGSTINQGEPEKSANYYTDDFILHVITGPGYSPLNANGIPNGTGTDIHYRMDTDYIYSSLTQTGQNMTKGALLSKLYYFSTTVKSIKCIKLIGGLFYNWLTVNFLTRPNYSGSNYGENWNQTSDISSNGWQWNIDLSANANLNKWPTKTMTSPYGNTGKKNYDLNNILWCSLRSPRKIPVEKVADNQNDQLYHRFVTNFIDLKTGTNNHHASGGGYGRYPNTIDLPRASWKPYYSSTQTGNTNMTSIKNYTINADDTQYLDASGSELPTGGPEFSEERQISDIEYFKVYYKLLIPPKTESCSITYTFGEDSNSKMTFFRHTDMSGTPNPTGKSSINALRSEESITLTWEVPAVGALKETEMQSIILTDIASGFSYHTPVINFDPSLNKCLNLSGPLKDNYDISCNIFQPLFCPKEEDLNVRNGNPYITKTFDSNDTLPQVMDISYIPFNYEPYRYVNYATAIESNYYWLKSTYPQPIKIIDETIIYENEKIYPSSATPNDYNGTDTSNFLGATVISPFTPDAKYIEPVNIKISSSFDNSYNIIASVLSEQQKILAAQQEIAIFKRKHTVAPNSFRNSNALITQNPGGTINSWSVFFRSPEALNIINHLIPDYWKLPDKINNLRKSNQGTTWLYKDLYQFFSQWKQQIMTTNVYDILNIILKGYTQGTTQGLVEVGAVLINSNMDSRGSYGWSGVSIDGAQITGDIIYEVQGSNGLVSPYTLLERPIVVQLITISTGPFGPGGINYIGDTGGGTNTGISNSMYKLNNVLPDILRQGNNNGANFPNTTDDNYNGLFDINMAGWNEVPISQPRRQNKYFNNIKISPTPLKVLIVDISAVVQTNPDTKDMINVDNTKVTIKWTGFTFSSDISWNTYPVGQDGDIEWTISRYNLARGTTQILYTGILPFNLVTKEYSYDDTTVIVYDKYRWTVSGTYKWTGIRKLIPNSYIPTLPVVGFTTKDCFMCVFNRFPFGRYNTTSTNLKLFAPLRINRPEGQVDQFGNKVCGGGCSDPSNPNLNLFTTRSKISSSNNIYANTTNQLSKKETYVLLAKSRFRPFR